MQYVALWRSYEILYMQQKKLQTDSYTKNYDEPQL